MVDRADAGLGTFSLAFVEPSDLIRSRTPLCLFDRANFSGERFTVKALDGTERASISSS